MEKQFFFSTKALIIKENKFLAMYFMVDGEKVWDLPGGRMEFGETAEETLTREIREELGVQIKPIKLVDTWNYMRDEFFQITGVIYHSEIVSGEIVISDEHDGYEWISIDDNGNTFTREAFLERMRFWNWESIMDNSITFRE
ncbi:NUDIX domain-containing protein [Clostridium grantii]|uniref:8-oxo-dGTP diphosphatase n=1 Tax=Clostridium grantii DSM 8605 TaxID=1121316 RepID=A0A1M5VLE1_9CLOT|nr:NUDIX domain-containing protein [Clostridium grantii]SHH76045.1 8-oxo-dGTP diphosphatase [Clostridium grantii DSM 8605]